MALNTKWDCPLCTYLNWSSTAKCVLCGCSRPTHGTIVPPKSTIAKLKQATQGSLSITKSQTPTSKSPSRTSSGGGTGGVLGAGAVPETRRRSQWSCGECTYLNWSNSSTCTLCSTPRNKMATPTSHQTPPTLSSRKVSKSGSIFDYAGTSEATPSLEPTRPSKVSKHNKKPSPQYEKKQISPSSSSSSSSSSSKKWICPTCTYENWPRSVKCVMCQRVPSPQLLPPGAVGGRDSEDDSENAIPSTSPYSVERSTMKHESFAPVLPSSTSTSTTTTSSSSSSEDDLMRQVRNRFTTLDWLFLEACRGVISHDLMAVKAYLKQGGDRGRQLTSDEVMVLNEPSKFTVGSTLVHLAVRFHQSDVLSYLLTPAPVEARKRLPSQANPDLASEIRDLVSRALVSQGSEEGRGGAGDWSCHYMDQLTTFLLPQEISGFNLAITQKIFEEIIDIDVQKELQEEGPVINWSSEITDDLQSRLYPLWNRTAGDCLLDSVLQATWGIVDRENNLRQALSDSLNNGSSKFYECWKESELSHAHAQQFNIEEEQLKSDWSVILSSADRQGKPLEQIHIFVLSHILRRPVIVYGVKMVKNYKGEQLGLANFEGVYLPLLWDMSFCWRVPIALGYTRGHFSALVGMRQSCDVHVTYLPLVDCDLNPLPVMFVSDNEVISSHEDLIKRYCDCHVTHGGILTAKQCFDSGEQEPPQLTSLVQDWLDKFVKLNKKHDTL